MRIQQQQLEGETKAHGKVSAEASASEVDYFASPSFTGFKAG
jgi:hypothetical protein